MEYRFSRILDCFYNPLITTNTLNASSDCEDWNYNGICDKYETTDCDDNNWNGICDEEEYGGGSDSDNDNADDDKIINELTDECAKEVFAGLENGIHENNPLKSNMRAPDNSRSLNFSESILKLFDESSHTHLTIRNRDLEKENAYTVKSTITMSNNYLKNATQLSIARTMIHESVHAYINALYSNVVLFNSFSFRDKLEKYAKENGYTIETNRFHHEFMGQYVNAMAVSLYEWDKRHGTGGNLGWDYYKAMAWGGLFQTDPSGNIAIETDSFKKLVPRSRDRRNIARKVLNEQKGNKNAKGTKCN